MRTAPTRIRPGQPARPGSRTKIVKPARRWQLAGLAIAIALVIATVAALAATHKPAAPGNGGAAPPAGSQQLAAAAAVRGQAVSWVAAQVGHDVTVACDAVTCSSLAAHRFPAGNLTVLQPTAPDPYGSVLVIATADIRSQFGSKLSSVYAPEVIASFGTGPDRIDIRVIAPSGPAAFQAALRADLAARKSSGAQLLRNGRITASAVARSQLASGLVDSRLLTTLAFLAGQHPISIVGFGGVAAGAGPGVPLRTVYLADTDAATHLTGSAYVNALRAVLLAQSPPYVPLSVVSAQLPGGQPVLQIEFAAPSPVGLLQS
jgi:hypothetical protein